MNALLAAALALCLQPAPAPAGALEPREVAAPPDAGDFGARRERLFGRLSPSEVSAFERLFLMTQDKPRARRAILEVGEDIVLLREVERNKDFMTPEKYSRLRSDLIEQVDGMLEHPILRAAVAAEIGESLASVGYKLPGGQLPPRPPPPPGELPEHPSGSDVRAQDALRSGDYASAEDQARQAAEKNPRDVLAQALRATALALLGRPKEAVPVMEMVSQISPPNTHIFATHAFVLNMADFHKAAKDAAEKALRLQPGNSGALYQLAFAQAGLLDREGSLRALSGAAELDPRDYRRLYRQASRASSDQELLDIFRAHPTMVTLSPLVGRRSAWQAAVLAVLAVLALPALLLYRRRGAIAAWIVRRGLVEAGTPLPPSGQLGALITGAQASGSRDAREITPASGRIPTGYKIIRQIGMGGMGAVYEAEDLSLERRVAIKRMRDEIRRDPRELERFLKEARLVAKLRHPNIIEIHAIVEREGEVFLVFEFIEGMTLDQALAKHRRLSTVQARAVLRQICSALGYAHEQGVIHRDLKPSNVMFTRESLVKVMDFGVARQAKDVMNRLSMTGTVAGSPPYMAPESERGVVRRESDLYSLGVCLYEMLTGSRPFEGTGAAVLLDKTAMRFEPASRRAEGLGPGVDAFFLRALQSDPEKRPRTAAEFASAFEAAAGLTPRPS